jgi:hypothetical protein
MTLACRYPSTPDLMLSVTVMGENARTGLSRMVTAGISEDRALAFIRAGNVRVAGQVVTDPSTVDDSEPGPTIMAI